MKIICIISSKGFELKIQKKKLRTKTLRDNRQKKKKESWGIWNVTCPGERMEIMLSSFILKLHLFLSSTGKLCSIYIVIL